MKTKSASMQGFDILVDTLLAQIKEEIRRMKSLAKKNTSSRMHFLAASGLTPSMQEEYALIFEE